MRTALMGALITYLVIASITTILILSLFAHDLVEIVPAKYVGAAPLIPLLGLRWGTKAFFQAIYRSAGFPTKQRAYVRSTVTAAAIFLILSVLLIPTWGAYGAGAAASRSPRS